MKMIISKVQKKLSLVALGAMASCSSPGPQQRVPQSTSAATVTTATGPASFEGFKLKAVYEPVPGLTIFHYQHDQSGLEVLLNMRPNTNTLTYVTAYNVGSRFELPGRTGIAHLFEHLMFRGTESYPVPFQTLSGWGNSFNAFTASDITLYHEVVPRTVFDDVAKFESERMRKLKLTEEGFKAERGAVISERKMRTEDAPSGRLFWELAQTFYKVHPYQTGPIGWQEDLNATSYADALKFYQRFYAPNRAVISIVGDFKIEEALGILHKYYGGFKRTEFVEPKIPQEPVHTSNIRKVIPMKTESVMLAHATLGTKMTDSTVAADSLFCSLLTDPRIGYLETELVEKNIARGVSGDCSPSVDPGMNALIVTGNPGVKVPALEKAFDSAMKKFGSWVTSDRVEKAKMYYLASQWSSLRQPDNLAETIANNLTVSGSALYDFDFLKSAQSVTREQVLARFNDWQKQKYVRIILQPSDKNPPFVYPARYVKFLKKAGK